MQRALVCLLLLAGCGDSSTTGAGGSTASTSEASSVSATSSESSSSDATTSASSSSSSTGSGGVGGAPVDPCADVAPPNETLPDKTDPDAAGFTLEQALADLPAGDGPLRAIIDTDLGTLTCTFHADEVPNGVANFIGLARGRRAWKDTKAKAWVRRPFYDGLTFHRVIADFVAQGGDPKGTGVGGPGYEFDDEISADLHHLAGTMAYANSGPDTNGSQFYVCEDPQPELDGGYTIFGECTPTSVVTALTHVATDSNDKPVTPLHMRSIKITRCVE